MHRNDNSNHFSKPLTSMSKYAVPHLDPPIKKRDMRFTFALVPRSEVIL